MFDAVRMLKGSINRLKIQLIDSNVKDLQKEIHSLPSFTGAVLSATFVENVTSSLAVIG